MAQVLIRNIDEQTVAAYREAARHNQRSLEAELRHVIDSCKPLGEDERAELRNEFAALRARTLKEPRLASEEVIRELRDAM